MLPAVLLAIGVLAVASYLRSAAAHAGATTESTALLAPLLGLLVAWREPLPAMSLAVLVTLLLTLKAPLHRIAGIVTEEGIVSILKFALVPRHVGLAVVILSAVSLGGCLLVRLLGSGAG